MTSADGSLTPAQRAPPGAPARGLSATRLALVAGLGALAHVCGVAWGSPLLEIGAKPIPVLVLALGAWPEDHDRFARLISGGLLLSAMADVTIEWSFLGGLATFLAAHLAYIGAFGTEVRELRPLRGVPALALAAAAFALLGPGLGAMRAPVAAYVVVLCTLLWRAAARVGGSPRGRASEHAALWGAATFAASDALLAFDRFRSPVPGAPYAIILLYWLGQLGLAASARRLGPPLSRRGEHSRS